MKLNDKFKCTGFTTYELMISVLILAILAAIAIPAIGNFKEKRIIIGAAEEIYSQLQLARSEALKQSNSINVNFALTGTSPSTSWNFGISTSSCNPDITDPSTSNACIINIDGTDVLKRTSSTNFPGISMKTPNFTTVTVGGVTTQETGFEPMRGTTSDNGTIVLTSQNYSIEITVSNIGRFRIYSPSGSNHVAGYPAS